METKTADSEKTKTTFNKIQNLPVNDINDVLQNEWKELDINNLDNKDDQAVYVTNINQQKPHPSRDESNHYKESGSSSKENSMLESKSSRDNFN